MEEIDLKELFRVFWREKIIITLLTAIFMVMGYIYTLYMVVPEYRSSTTLILTQANTSKTEDSTAITTTDITLNSKLISTYSELVKSNSVIRKVISNLEINDTEESIKKKVSVTAVSNTEILKITVSNQNAEKAAKIANEIVVVFADEVKRHYGIDNVSIVDVAEPKTEPANINLVKNVIVFGAIGCVLGIGYVFLTFILDNTVKTREDLERYANVPVLAQIPLYEPRSHQKVEKQSKKAKGGRRK